MGWVVKSTQIFAKSNKGFAILSLELVRILAFDTPLVYLKVMIYNLYARIIA